MTYKVHVARRAEQDRDETFKWYSAHYSGAFAADWYCGISQAIRSLANNPLRCGRARENDRFPFDLRELLYSRSKKNRHRILFTVEDNTVYVLHIRHTAQDEMREGDLGGR